MGIGRKKPRAFLKLGLWLGAVVAMSSCAADRRTSLERVAKDWCETIRASQVIPVYPLTADLRPGDVFLVQMPISQQEEVYEKRGFLSLDDHKTRLANPGFQGMYFDGYFKDPYKDVSHPYPRREAGALQGDGAAAAAISSLSNASAPRAAFPTYTFEVQSGTSGALALPIQGVPLGLNFLNTQQATGTVTIADARTYAGDEGQLLAALQEWARKSEVQRMLSDTVSQMSGRPVLLRVVSRVYLTGSVVVSLTRSDASGGGVSAGAAPDVPPLTDENGEPNAEHDSVLKALNAAPSSPKQLTDTGGAVQFVSVSSSSVAMAESFDTMLVIGYLGFDVPVFDGGVLGAPIPTFQNLEGRLDSRLTARQADSRYLLQMKALEGLIAWSDSEKAPPLKQVKHAADIIVAVAKVMDLRVFDAAQSDAQASLDAISRAEALASSGKSSDPACVQADADARRLARKAADEFRESAETYFQGDAQARMQTRWFSEVLDREYARATSPGGGA